MGEPRRAGGRQVLAPRWTLLMPPLNCPLRSAGPAWPESSPTRRGSPGIFGAGTLLSRRFNGAGWEDHHRDSGKFLFL